MNGMFVIMKTGRKENIFILSKAKICIMKQNQLIVLINNQICYNTKQNTYISNTQSI